MKVEEIAEAIAKLPPDQLARFRRWFTAFEEGRTDHAEELTSSAVVAAIMPAYFEVGQVAKERHVQLGASGFVNIRAEKRSCLFPIF